MFFPNFFLFVGKKEEEKKRQFYPNIKPFKCPLSFVCHLGDICTGFGGWAIPVFMQGSFWRLLLKLVQTGFCLFSNYPNLQPKKRNCNIQHQDFCINNFFFLWYNNIYCTKGHTDVKRQSYITSPFRIELENTNSIRTHHLVLPLKSW